MLASMSWQLKARLALGLLTMVLLLTNVIAHPWLRLGGTLVVYVIVAYPVCLAAFSNLIKRHRLSEQFLMMVATFGALGLQDYPEALAVMVFYLIGDAFEDYAAQRSHREIESLVKLRPTQVRVVNDDGTVTIMKPRKVKIGTRIRVLAGEAVALDGTLVEGSAALDMSALTGESEPVLFTAGQEISSGGINMGKVIDLVVTKDHKNSSITRLLNLIEDASANKSRPEALITRFAVYYTPIVVGCAVCLALVPLFFPQEDVANWLTRALIFLVVSCPCALVLSVPLSFFGGLGALSKIGVLVKGSVFIETLGKLKAMAFDKTGTLTKGHFSVIEETLFLAPQASQSADAVSTATDAASTTANTAANATNASAAEPKAIVLMQRGQLKEEAEAYAAARRDLLGKLAALEAQTTHPVGTAIVNYCASQGIDVNKSAEAATTVSDKAAAVDAAAAASSEWQVTAVQELTGYGLTGVINGHEVQVGQGRLLTEKLGIALPARTDVVGTEVYVVEDGKLLGRVVLADDVKESAPAMLSELSAAGIKSYMITGDKERVAADLAARCHLDAYYAEQLPQDKLDTLSKLKQEHGVIGYVGDGINDAPTLATADVGIAMGQFGSAAAVEAADVVVMTDDLTKIPRAIDLAQRTFALAKQNMVLVIAVKVLILILGALGIANIWLAIFGDVGLCVIAVLNAMRPLLWVKSPAVSATAVAAVA